MNIKAFRHLWGVTEPFEFALPKILAAGYDGIEFAILKTMSSSFLKSFLRDNDLSYIAQIHTTGVTVADHFESFKHLTEMSLRLDPILINSQSGADRWSLDEKKEFLALVLEFQKKIPVPIAHETHRGRITYNPWETYALLMEFQELHLCCDFSHWVCVCERLLDTEADIIQYCANRCIHLHTRVGYEQGPQVPDPRAPEYERHLNAHENWWEIVWRSQIERQLPFTTFTPEFGPPLYQQTIPYSQMPTADLWKVCNWMKDRQLNRAKTLINTLAN